MLKKGRQVLYRMIKGRYQCIFLIGRVDVRRWMQLTENIEALLADTGTDGVEAGIF